MKQIGDFDPAATLYTKFTTYRPSTGAPFTLAGTPAISVYKDGSATQSTSGVTLTADFDSVTGLNHVAIDTSSDGTFYSAGSFFEIVITTGTVDGVSVVGSVVAGFTLRKDSALKSTTAGRTLDVSAGGEAGMDWANIGSPTTAQNLSGTNIDVDQVVATVSGNVNGNVGGNVTGTVGTVNALAANSITAASTATDFVTEMQAAAAAAITAASLATAANVVAVETDTQDIQARLPAALISGRIDSTVGAMQANVMTAAAAAADLTTELQTGLATAANLAIVDTVVDAIQAKTDNLPSDPADQSLVVAATTAIYDRIGAPAGASVSADMAAVKVDTAATRTSADRLDDTLTLTSDGYIFSTNALQNAPTGGGGSAPTAVEIANEVETRTIAAVAVVNGLSSGAVDDILGATVEGSTSFVESLRLANSALAGKASGLGTTEVTFRDLADTKDRLVATVDGVDGNRTAVVRDLS